jgi:hypothetical protein
VTAPRSPTGKAKEAGPRGRIHATGPLRRFVPIPSHLHRLPRVDTGLASCLLFFLPFPFLSFCRTVGLVFLLTLVFISSFSFSSLLLPLSGDILLQLTCSCNTHSFNPPDPGYKHEKEGRLTKTSSYITPRLHTYAKQQPRSLFSQSLSSLSRYHPPPSKNLRLTFPSSNPVTARPAQALRMWWLNTKPPT